MLMPMFVVLVKHGESQEKSKTQVMRRWESCGRSRWWQGERVNEGGEMNVTKTYYVDQ